MRISLLILGAAFAASSGIGFAQVTVRVEPPNLRDFRPLPEQTEKSAIRDYLQSWQSFKSALEQNRADLLDPDFVGTARDKFIETIQQQASSGIRTRYRDTSHDITIAYYSPDGLSIQLIDKVEYDVGVLDDDKLKTTQHMSVRYVIVLTPAELRWRVRIFQANPE